jgi:hypothetical protein
LPRGAPVLPERRLQEAVNKTLAKTRKILKTHPQNVLQTSKNDSMKFKGISKLKKLRADSGLHQLKRSSRNEQAYQTKVG